jgi:hypothetical protein
MLMCLCDLAPIAEKGGGGIETVGISGTAVDRNSGLPVARAQVRLRNASFLADLPETGQEQPSYVSIDTVTDGAGRFTIDSVDTGAYTIEINDGKTHAVVIRRTFSGDHAVVDIGADTLEPTGAITGSAGVSVTADTRFARIFGLQRYAIVDPKGGYTLTDIPEGIYSLQIVDADAASVGKNIDSVLVIAGASTVAPSMGWQFSRKWYLNTTSSGANVSGTVVGFPVLIRLTDSTFPFNEAQSGGNDIRFAKADGTMLPFSIERWDRSEEAAELWVKTDSVFGNDSSHSFVMLWGNPAAVSASNDAAVFGAGNGFTAVWHLDADCRDASGNSHNGTNHGATDAAGIIGTAKKFNGADSIVINGLLGMPQNLTLSAWVAVDTTIPSGQEIVSIGDAVLLRSEETINSAGTGAYFYSTADTFVPVSSDRFFAGTGWRHVAFTFDNSSHLQTLYLDGSPVSSMNDVGPINYAKVGANTVIGAHGKGKKTFNSHATIDEVRVCGVVRSSDWIKLCAMNQRTDDRLVVFK